MNSSCSKIDFHEKEIDYLPPEKRVNFYPVRTPYELGSSTASTSSTASSASNPLPPLFSMPQELVTTTPLNPTSIPSTTLLLPLITGPSVIRNLRPITMGPAPSSSSSGSNRIHEILSDLKSLPVYSQLSILNPQPPTSSFPDLNQTLLDLKALIDSDSNLSTLSSAKKFSFYFVAKCSGSQEDSPSNLASTPSKTSGQRGKRKRGAEPECKRPHKEAKNSKERNLYSENLVSFSSFLKCTIESANVFVKNINFFTYADLLNQFHPFLLLIEKQQKMEWHDPLGPNKVSIMGTKTLALINNCQSDFCQLLQPGQLTEKNVLAFKEKYLKKLTLFGSKHGKRFLSRDFFSPILEKPYEVSLQKKALPILRLMRLVMLGYKQVAAIYIFLIRHSPECAEWLLKVRREWTLEHYTKQLLVASLFSIYTEKAIADVSDKKPLSNDFWLSCHRFSDCLYFMNLDLFFAAKALFHLTGENV